MKPRPGPKKNPAKVKPRIAFAADLTISEPDGTILASREVDGKVQIVRIEPTEDECYRHVCGGEDMTRRHTVTRNRMKRGNQAPQV